MIPGGLTETIWHFAGHFQIVHDIARDRIDYDHSAFRSKPDDYTTARPEYTYDPDPDELDSRGIQMPPLALFDELNAARMHAIRPLSTPDQESDFDPIHGVNLAPLRGAGGGGGGGGGGSHHAISITYKPGGEQTQLEVHQYNLNSDNDVLLQGHGPAPVLDGQIAQLSTHADAVLQAMAADASNVVPQEWWIPHTGEGVVEFLRNAEAPSDSMPSPNSVEPGYYLNGELQVPAPDPPLPKLEFYERPDLGNAVGQWAETGANSNFNAAIIVDLTESGQTMIVMGDYYSTNAIFQTNSLIDHDQVEAAGAGAPSISPASNTTDNIADFVEHPGLYSMVPAHFGGWEWHVDVVDGNYYSVHTVTQTNFLMDDDVVTQTSSGAHYEVVSGANGEVNLAEVFDGDIHYDLIIVAGTYHGMNVIFQNNILLDNDQIQQFAEGHGSSQGVSSSGNELINAATIETFGGDKFVPMSDDMQAIVSAIASGAATLDPALGSILAGPDGVINVLYITGDYYDVNAIWQTNVTSDIDVILQMLDHSADVASINPEDPGTQSASAGGNNLINEAVIVDVAATNTYVNGEVYADTILVQANLLPTDLDKAVNGDTETLITELVAFVDENQNDGPPPLQPMASQPHDDAVANVTH